MSTLYNRASNWLNRQINQHLDQVPDGRHPWEASLPPLPRLPERPVRTVPAPLTSDDISDFERAASERPAPYHQPRPARARASTWDSFMKGMNRLYPLRMARIERDLRWLRRRALDAGLDPEDVRWIVGK